MSYEAILECAYCKKKTKINDELFLQVMNGQREIYDLCDCGHTSYCSTIKAKFLVETKGWRACYGSLK